MKMKFISFFGAALLGIVLSTAAHAQCSGGPVANPGYYYPPPVTYPTYTQPTYTQPTQPTYTYPTYTYPAYTQPTYTYPPTTRVFENIPIPVETVVEKSNETEGKIEIVEPLKTAAQPWNQWADMPPLKGDFQAMIHQVTGDIDWMLTAQGEKFSPEVAAILVEAKTNLETSCRVCDEDPDLFAGVQPGGDSVRNVTEQLEGFRQLISKSLQQPSMQQLTATVAPARADKSKIKSVMGPLDGDTKKKLFGMFALETLEKRGDELVAHAKSVENGTFRPVGVDSLQQDLKTGDVAPNFSIQTADGNMVSLADYRGKKVVLVFNRGHF